MRQTRISIRGRTVLGAVLATLALVGSAAADWPLYRGDARQMGIAAGRLSNRPKLVWKFKTGGPVLSSPVVAGDRVFVGSSDKFVYAFSLRDGKKLWTFKTKGAVEAPACVVDGKVIIGSEDGHLYALDAATGKLRWDYMSDDKIAGAANAAPAPDGKGWWVVVGSYDSRVHCVNAQTGKRVWVFDTGNYVNGTPAVSDGQVVFGGCDGILYVVRLNDGQKIRAIDVSDYIAGSVAVDGRYAYLGHYGNQVIGVDLATGKVAWNFRDRQFPYFSSPALAGDRLVIGGRDKRLHCLSRRDGKGLWDFPTRGKVDSSPVICDGKVVVGSEDGRLYMVGLNDGKQLWYYPIGKPVMSSPAVTNGRIIVGANDGVVYAFG